jgi:hypothetical protein
MLKLEDILGVYILDETRIPEDELELFSHQVTKLHLYLDEKKRASYRYHFYTLDPQREINIYEEGFISYNPSPGYFFVTFAIVDKYESQIYLAGADNQDYKRHEHYQPPRMDRLTIQMDNGFCLENKGHFYIPIAQDIYGRKAEDIALQLISIGHHYRENWDTLLRP